MKTFAEQIKDIIAETGYSQKRIAEEINIPLRTLESWIEGKRVPDKFKQWAVIEQIRRIRDANKYWARPQSIYKQPILIGNANSPEEAAEKLQNSKSFNVIEIIGRGETSKTTHDVNKIYSIDRDGLSTGIAVVIE